VLIAVNPTRWKQIFWFEGGGEEVQFSCDLGWTRVFLGRRSSLYCFRSFGSKEEEEKKYSLVVIWGGQGFFGKEFFILFYVCCGFLHLREDRVFCKLGMFNELK
jgi:hypothetical protein